MKELVEITGGNIIIASWFEDPIFKQSFIKLFEKNNYLLKSGSTASIAIVNSKCFQVCGLIGYGISLGSEGDNVSMKSIGTGWTNKWKLGGIIFRSGRIFNV